MSVPQTTAQALAQCFRELATRQSGQNAREDTYNAANFMLVDALHTTNRLGMPAYSDAKISLVMWQLMEIASRDVAHGDAHRKLERLFSPCQELDECLGDIIAQTPRLRGIFAEIPTVDDAKLFTADYKLERRPRQRPQSQTTALEPAPRNARTREPLVDDKMDIVAELCRYMQTFVALLGKIVRHEARLRRVCERMNLYMSNNELYEGKGTLSAGGILTMLYLLRASLVHGVREGILSDDLVLRMLSHFIVWIAMIPESGEIGLHGIYVMHLIWNVLRPAIPFESMSDAQRVLFRIVRKRCMALMIPIVDAIGTYSDKMTLPPGDNGTANTPDAYAAHYVRSLAAAMDGFCQNRDCTCVNAKITTQPGSLPSRAYRFGQDPSSLGEATWVFHRFRRCVGPAALLNTILAGDLSDCRSKVMRTTWAIMSPQAMALDIFSTGVKKRECGYDSGKTGGFIMSAEELACSSTRKLVSNYILLPKRDDLRTFLRAAFRGPRPEVACAYDRCITAEQNVFLSGYRSFWKDRIAPPSPPVQKWSSTSKYWYSHLTQKDPGGGTDWCNVPGDADKDPLGVQLVEALLDSDVSFSPLSSPAPATPSPTYDVMKSRRTLSPHFQQSVFEAFQKDEQATASSSSASASTFQIGGPVRRRVIALPPSWPSPL
ncbi:unnamed protein product [Peniophora sp. CBMAI 1063]|nr:unnamed protein product [Peniophora sp. CBMAI 1063]